MALDVGLSFGSTALSWPSPTKLMSRLLAAIGKTEADFVALGDESIKSLAPWATIGRALNGPYGGVDIAAAKLGNDYNAFVHVTDQKWKSTEATAGVYTYTNSDATDTAALAAIPGGKRLLHLVFGWDNYNPAWVNSSVNSTNLGTLITNRISSLAAKYPGDPFHRIDVVNELTADATSTPTSYAADRGFRTTGCSFYTAGLARDPSDRMKWVRDAFTATRAAFPTARLAWTDNEIEACFPPDTYIQSVNPAGGNAFYTDGRRNVLMTRSNRIKYEIWDARSKGAPIDAVGYQMHISPMAPPNFDDLRAVFWDYNRFGTIPLITELNLARSSAVATLPPHLPQDTTALDRYMARSAYYYIKEFLTHSLCDEITQWTAESLPPYNYQVATEAGTDFPLRAILMLALKDAVAPGSRTLKRGTRINGGFALPPQVAFLVGSGSGVLSSGGYSYINGQTGTAPIIPWTWMNAAWMARPISNSDVIMSAQFQIAGALSAGDKVLMGYGNSATTAAPTDRAYLFLNGTTLKLHINVASAGAANVNLATGLALNTPHRVAVRVNGTAISYSVNGGPVQTATATAAMAAPTAAYILARSGGTDSDPSIRFKELEFHHGPDYPTNGDLQSLSTVKAKDVSLPFYDGL